MELVGNDVSRTDTIEEKYNFKTCTSNMEGLVSFGYSTNGLVWAGRMVCIWFLKIYFNR